MHSLTCRAVTVFRRQGLIPTELVFYLAAVAFASPFDVELVVVLVDSVRWAELPLVFLAVGTFACLVLVCFFAGAAVLLLLVLVFGIRHLGPSCCD